MTVLDALLGARLGEAFESHKHPRDFRGRWRRVTADLAAGRVKDTESAYRERLPDGSLGAYKPERVELHQRIANELLAGKGRHPGKARAVFLAGGPASGKSTIVKHGHVDLPADAVDVNPDIVREMLPEYGALLKAGDSAAAAKTHEEASHLAKTVLNLALARQHHVIVDSVGGGAHGAFAGRIKRTVQAGHKAEVVYATVDTAEAERRAAKREKRSGRQVPVGYLRAAHAQVSQRFLDDVSQIGVPVRVFDNNGAKPKLIYRQGSSAKVGEIVDRKAYARFVAKARHGG